MIGTPISICDISVWINVTDTTISFHHTIVDTMWYEIEYVRNLVFYLVEGVINFLDIIYEKEKCVVLCLRACVWRYLSELLRANRKSDRLKIGLYVEFLGKIMGKSEHFLISVIKGFKWIITYLNEFQIIPFLNEF